MTLGTELGVEVGMIDKTVDGIELGALLGFNEGALFGMLLGANKHLG